MLLLFGQSRVSSVDKYLHFFVNEESQPTAESIVSQLRTIYPYKKRQSHVSVRKVTQCIEY